MTASSAVAAGRTGGESPTHVCPWWVGYLLLSPLRRLVEDPQRLLGPHVRPGTRVLEVGCGMGYFTLPLARLVGESGRVVCRDVQPRMISALERRLRRAGLAGRVEARCCDPGGLSLAGHEGSFDLAVLLHVLHEMAEAGTSLAEIRAALAPGGRVLLVEPRGHVSAAAFEAELEVAAAAGLRVESRLPQRRGYGAVLVAA